MLTAKKTSEDRPEKVGSQQTDWITNHEAINRFMIRIDAVMCGCDGLHDCHFGKFFVVYTLYLLGNDVLSGGGEG